MKDRWIIAVATNDGVYVERHLGQARSFAIYDIRNTGRYDLIEYRTLRGNNHLPFYNPSKISPFFEDVNVVIATEVGKGARGSLAQLGIYVLCLDGKVDTALQCIAAVGAVLFRGVRGSAERPPLPFSLPAGGENSVSDDDIAPALPARLFGRNIRGLA